MEIIIRDIKLEDMEDYLHMNHPSRKFHEFNGPYFKRTTEEELIENVRVIKNKIKDGVENPFGQKKIIADKHTDKIIGVVNWYWKSQETAWLEVGLAIFNEDYWGKGIGTIALKQWIDMVFNQRPDIIRIGLTTWSGNKRMMALAEKLGLNLEACYKSARIVKDEYYDSISYGILKKDWVENRSK